MEVKRRGTALAPGGSDADERFNFAAFLIDASGWFLGMSFLSSTTILPYYVRNLTSSDEAIGAIPAVIAIGSLLPQVFSAPSSERRPIQRRFVLAVASLERIPYLVLAGVTFFVGLQAGSLLLTCFFVCIAANAVAMGVNTPAYAAMLSKVIRPDLRGRLYGVGNAVSGVLGVGGAAACAWLLATYPPRIAFSLCFLIGFVVLAITVVPLGFVREPPGRVEEAQPFGAYLRGAAGVLSSDRDFARFLVSQALLSVAITASAFYTVHAMDRFNIPKQQSSEIGAFNMALILAAVVGGILWGHVADRRGNRVVLAVGTAALIVVPIAAIHAPSVAFFTGLFFANGLATAAWDLSSFNIVMEFSRPERVPTYSALRALVIGPVRGVAPLAASWLAQVRKEEWGYAPVFLLCAACALVSLLLLLRMREPRHDLGRAVANTV